MTLAQIVACGIVGTLTSWLAIWVVQRRSAHAGAASSAALNQFHHTHELPVSRLGGIAFAISFAAVAILACVFLAGQPLQRHSMALITGALAMFAVGLADDLRPLGAKKKLLLQILISVLVYFWGL